MRIKPCLVLFLLLAGCAAPPVPPSPAARGAPAPCSSYLDAAARTPVYRIDPQASIITVVVRRGGPFARLGHDHAIASKAVSGYAAPAQGRAAFGFRLDQMTVDDAEVRAAAGLPGAVPADAIAGTRANMLGRVLEADRYPAVQLEVRQLAGAGRPLRLSVTLHGMTRTVDVPAALEVTPDKLAASGSFRLRQSGFGITPMSVLGGALVVQDEMELSFRIHARRVR